MSNFTPADSVDTVPDETSPVEMARLNLSAVINTGGRGLVVRPFKVDGIETAMICIVQSSTISDVEGHPDEVAVKARLVPLFMLMVPEQNFKLEALPMDGERELLAVPVRHDANTPDATGHS